MRIVGSGALLLNLNFLWFFFFLLFINHGVLFVMVEAGCTTSCGKLNNIYFPFRVRDDPKHCGDADYELFCEDGEAFFYMGAHKYFVTQIEYFSNPMSIDATGSMTIHVDCPFTNNTCRLHPDFSYSFSRLTDAWLLYTTSSWASFMECPEKIDIDASCDLVSDCTLVRTVPSLSGENTTTYVVVAYNANELGYLHKSCKFVDTFLFGDDYGNSSKQVIEALQQGFQRLWYYSNATATNCWTYALRDGNEYSFSFHFLVSHRFDIVYNFFNCLSAKACHTFINDKLNKCASILKYSTTITGIILAVLLVLALVFKFLLAPLTVCVYLIYNYWKNTKPVDSIEFFLQKQQLLLPRRFTYGEIMAMTRHFKEKLGKGGFGQVYKGELFGGHFVAVKVLNDLQFNGDDFINEVSTIGMIHHVNIVQLVGFCSEGTKRALIYEYMSNGSLDKYIFYSFEKSTSFSLTLEKLDSIAIGIAKGINYLHTGCDMQILHFDIKPHNILLDDNFNPKISDFGLAKLYPKGQSLVSISAARGTIGYIAPELISRSFGIISHKSDVYSFGMLILEMAGKRRNFDTRVQNSKEVYYPSWIYDQLTHLEASNLVEITEIGELERKLCKVGLWCIQVNPSNRPTMSEVIKFLESDADDIEMPPKPFFSSTDATNEAHTCFHSSSLALPIIAEHDDLSANDLV